MRKDLLGRYARLGIVLAAFTLVVGIIGAPALPQFWPPSVIGAQAKGMLIGGAEGGERH
jgi:hypothetical protein